MGVKAYNSLRAQSPRHAANFRSLLDWPYARVVPPGEGLLGFDPAGFQLWQVRQGTQVACGGPADQ
jgi:hypothetical protein